MGQSKIQVLALTRYDELGASSRVRLLQFIPSLSSNSIETVVSPLFDKSYINLIYGNSSPSKSYLANRFLKRILLLISIKKFDFVWIEKEAFPYFPPFFELALNLCRVKFIVDFDDAIFHNYDLHRHWLVKKILGKKIDQIMRMSDLVTCGNEYLAHRANKSNAKRVKIIPSVIDIDRYNVSKKQVEGVPFTIGWIGSPTSIVHFQLIVHSLRRISNDYNVRVVVVGANLDIPGVDVVCLSWAEDKEVALINMFDVGIMPLRDSPWERGKCGFKLVQYMACAVPVIASPVGVNKRIVSQGHNGYLAQTDDDWYESFEKLIKSTSLRENLGKNGRNLVEQKYSIQAVEQDFVDQFKRLNEA